MMSKNKKTEWFDGAKLVPYYLGVYETMNGGYYQYWNGKYWGLAMETIDSAFNHTRRSLFQNTSWRGIKK
jgi:hypothetical protein